MGVSCPNCKIPCTGCAGAKLTKAVDGTPCCTKCVTSVNARIQKTPKPSVFQPVKTPTAPTDVKVGYTPKQQ